MNISCSLTSEIPNLIQFNSIQAFNSGYGSQLYNYNNFEYHETKLSLGPGKPQRWCFFTILITICVADITKVC